MTYANAIFPRAALTSAFAGMPTREVTIPTSIHSVSIVAKYFSSILKSQKSSPALAVRRAASIGKHNHSFRVWGRGLSQVQSLASCNRRRRTNFCPRAGV
eukprot:Blabericola_migrator_1__6671@NODE_3369_length_1827_cov_7_956818_g2100_i0_p2_GENE_NODE_3369_length_1827_cov_7_956818_g2100_i0NODE_3369_length_1827_cov_7_956818_g2100_i0_p2_ORF_typecomplete_len100_score4_11_NODE_3369_length_1827_cov_7_956818_g2100_i0673972